MAVVSFGSGKRAGCGALGLLKRPARFCRGFVSKRGMWPDVVVVIPPEGQFLAGIRKAVEDRLPQARIAQAAVEDFDQAVLLGLARVDVDPLPCPMRPRRCQTFR